MDMKVVDAHVHGGGGHTFTTGDPEAAVDPLSDPAALERWLRTHDLLRGGPRPGPGARGRVSQSPLDQ